MICLLTIYEIRKVMRLWATCSCGGSVELSLQASAYSLYKHKKFGSIEETE